MDWDHGNRTKNLNSGDIYYWYAATMNQRLGRVVTITNLTNNCNKSSVDRISKRELAVIMIWLDAETRTKIGDNLWSLGIQD